MSDRDGAAKRFLIETDPKIEEAVFNGYDIRMEELEWLKKMQSYADQEVEREKREWLKLTTGDFAQHLSLILTGKKLSETTLEKIIHDWIHPKNNH